MILDISNALKNFGDVFDFTMSVNLPNQYIYGEDIAFTTTVINGQYGMVDDGIFVTGHLNTDLIGHCSRCLKDVGSKLSFEFSEIFVDYNKIPANNSSDDLIYYYRNAKIDLTPLILENLIPKIPMKFECDSNCINDAIYNQEISNRDSNPFDILKEFFKNDEEV